MQNLETLLENVELVGSKGISRVDLERRIFEKILVGVGYSDNLYYPEFVLSSVAWASQHSKEVLVLVADMPIAYNLIDLNFSKQDARYLSLCWGDKRKNDLQAEFSKYESRAKLNIVLLSQICKTKEEYSAIFKKIKNYANKNHDFKEGLVETIPEKLRKKYISKKEDERIENLMNYPIEQLAFVLYLAKRGYTVKIGNPRENLYDRILRKIFDSGNNADLKNELNLDIKHNELKFVYLNKK